MANMVNNIVSLVGGDWNIGEMYGILYGLMMVNNG